MNVNPDRGKGYWTFKVQQRNPNGTWTTRSKSYKTKGAAETRSINLKAGTYRVVVAGKYGFLGSVSAPSAWSSRYWSHRRPAPNRGRASSVSWSRPATGAADAVGQALPSARGQPTQARCILRSRAHPRPCATPEHTSGSEPSATDHAGDRPGKKRKAKRMDKGLYELELFRLQAELVEMQEWVRTTGARLVVLFEGRDAAGKGGTIQRIAQYLNPRVARIVALPAPTEREQSQWYFQRYVSHLPAAGEIALFDRSWYNRAGVERVMGFCTAEEYRRFLYQAPIFERMLVEDGIMLRKYWFSVSDEEQEARFHSRLEDPMRRWKLSPMDLESVTRWEDFSRAKDDMFVHTDTTPAPWYVVESDDKRRARVNAIAHLLSTIPYTHVERPPLQLPKRPPTTGYQRTPREMQTYVPDHAHALELATAAAPSKRQREGKH